MGEVNMDFYSKGRRVKHYLGIIPMPIRVKRPSTPMSPDTIKSQEVLDFF